MVDLTNRADAGAAQAFADPTMSRAGMDYTPPPRVGAFKAAGRHTARVRFLRRAIIFGAILGVSVISMIVAFDPFRHLPSGVSISGVGVKGTKITMDSPRLNGVQQGGGPYRIEARSGIQDITTPSVIELIDLDAHVGMADFTTTHILSTHGTYDSKEDTMALDGNVRIANTAGYTFTLRKAIMNFGAGEFTSDERTRVDLKGGTVSGDRMRISNNGHKIVFEGHIASVFDPPEETPDAPAGATASNAGVAP